MIVGFGKACTLFKADNNRDLRDAFLATLTVPHTVLGRSDTQWQGANIISLHIHGVPQEALVMALPDLAFGTGAACSSAGKDTSHVLKAIGLSQQQALEVIRISYGRFTTRTEMVAAAERINRAVQDLTTMKEVA
jgi:cysteine desulfurase